jgi:hypothetical protein
MVATSTAASGLRPPEAALDVEELLGAKVGPEACLGDDDVAECQRGARGHHRVAAMRDVAERAGVDECGTALQRLHQVGAHGILEEHRHRTGGLEVARADGLRSAPAGGADDDPTEPLLEVLEARCERDDRHDLARRDDDPALFARHAFRGAAEADDRLAQGAVVHVDGARPGDAARIEPESVALLQRVVEHRREQRVRRRDRVEVTGEVEVDVVHRQHLRVAAARRAALHAEDRTEARLADASTALVPSVRRACASPTLTVLFPSPAGVGEIAVTRTSLPLAGRVASSSGSFALYLP